MWRIALPALVNRNDARILVMLRAVDLDDERWRAP
jgi:hypothetical protein